MVELKSGPVIDRMKQVFELKNDIDLGRALGLGTSAVSTWRTQNRIPYADCVEIAISRGVSMDWLLFGVGESRNLPASADRPDLADSERLQRMADFLAHTAATRDADFATWLELQFARAVPEYAEWVAGRSKKG